MLTGSLKLIGFDIKNYHKQHFQKVRTRRWDAGVFHKKILPSLLLLRLSFSSNSDLFPLSRRDHGHKKNITRLSETTHNVSSIIYMPDRKCSWPGFVCSECVHPSQQHLASLSPSNVRSKTTYQRSRIILLQNKRSFCIFCRGTYRCA